MTLIAASLLMSKISSDVVDQKIVLNKSPLAYMYMDLCLRIAVSWDHAKLSIQFINGIRVVVSSNFIGLARMKWYACQRFKGLSLRTPQGPYSTSRSRIKPLLGWCPYFEVLGFTRFPWTKYKHKLSEQSCFKSSLTTHQWN